jgi:hypothetical protein
VLRRNDHGHASPIVYGWSRRIARPVLGRSFASITRRQPADQGGFVDDRSEHGDPDARLDPPRQEDERYEESADDVFRRVSPVLIGEPTDLFATLSRSSRQLLTEKA